MWGGYTKEDGDQQATYKGDVVYFLLSGKWIKMETRGDAPTAVNPNTKVAHVVSDKMQVLDNIMEETLYSLDLNVLTWKKLNPSGTPLPKQSGRVSSWVHRENVRQSFMENI